MFHCLRRILKIGFPLLIGVFCIFSGSVLAQAATRTWDGGGSGNSWSTKENWSGDTVPTAEDLVVFDGASSSKASTINSSFAGSVAGITINSTYTGTITQSRTLTIGATGFTQAGGTFKGGAYDIILNGDFTLSSGTFKASTKIFYINGNFTHTGGGTFTHNSGTVTFNATSGAKVFDFNTSDTFYHFTVNAPGGEMSIASGDSLIVKGTLILTDGMVDGSYLEAQGATTTVGAGFDGGNATLKFGGTTSNQSFNLTGAEDKYNGSIMVNKSSGTVTLFSGLTLEPGASFYMTAGTFFASTYNFTMPAGGTFYQQGGTFNGGSGALDIDSPINISGTGQFISTSGNFYVGSNFNHSAGIFNANNGTVIFDGDSLDRIFNPLESDSFYNFTIQPGTVSLNGESLTVTGSFNNNGTLRLRGNEILSLVLDPDSGAIEFVGDGDAAEDTIVMPSVFGSVYNLMFNPTDGVMDTFVLSAPLDVNGDLAIASGILDVSESSFGVIASGNWMNYGTFLARSGVVTFDDAGKMSTILGSHSFYNLNITTPGKMVYFTAGSMQTVLGTMTLAGSADQKVMLRSTEPGTYWNLNVVNSSVANVDVSDSDASFGHWIDAGLTSIFTEHNVNWYSNDPPIVSGINATQLQDGTGIVTISFIVNDPDLNDTIQALVEYNVGAGWQKATLSEEASTVSATYGLPNIENDNAWQVGNSSGYIATSFGENTVSVQWLSAVDVPTADFFNAQIRVTLFDALETSSIVSSSEFVLDHVAPIGLADFVALGTTSSSIQIGWTPVADSHFSHYEIWAGQVLEEVESRSGSALKWDSFHDANLTTISTSTTTLTGLLENTTYYLKIFAIDTYGNETSLSVIFVNNNARPGAVSFAAVPLMDGSGKVVLFFTAQDLDGDDTLRALVEYEVGAGWQKATLSEDPSDVTSTYGSPRIENDNAYSIGNADGWIVTSSGDNVVTVVWFSKTDVPIADLAFAQFRVTFYDGIESGDGTLLTDVTLDNAAPLAVSDFSILSTPSTTAQLAWTATTDTHFDHYEVWAGTDAAEVESRSGAAMEWDTEDDVNLNTATTGSTTFAGLLENIFYSAQIFAIDSYHNETASSLVSFSTNAKPTVSDVTATPLNNENGLVSIQFVSNDLNGQDGQALVEYTTGEGWQKATLSEYLATTTATFGMPDVENDNPYQVGNGDGYIKTSEGANTMTFLWDSFADEENLDAEYVQIRVTPYDGIETGEAVVTDEFVMDYAEPVGMADFILTTSGENFMGVWAPVLSESHFAHYEMWVGLSAEEVLARSGSAMEWGGEEDAAMSVMGSGSTIVVGMEPVEGNTYYAALWAIDVYGNESEPLTATLNILLPTPPVDEEEPAADEEEPAADEEEPAADEEEPVADEEEPVADEEEPAADEEEPAADEEEPAVVQSLGGGGGSSSWSHVWASVVHETTDETDDEVANNEDEPVEPVNLELPFIDTPEPLTENATEEKIITKPPEEIATADDFVQTGVEVFVNEVEQDQTQDDSNEPSSPISSTDPIKESPVTMAYSTSSPNVTFIQSFLTPPAGFSLRTQITRLAFRFLVDRAFQNIDVYAKVVAMIVNQAFLHSGIGFSTQPSVNSSGHMAYTPNDVSSKRLFGVERQTLPKVLCRMRK